MSPKCPKCFHSFSLSNHLPMILPSCLHHLCSYCVNSSPNPGSVQCWVQSCKESTRQQADALLVYDCHLLGNMDIKLYKIKQDRMHNSVAQFQPSLSHQTVPGSLKCFKCRTSISHRTCTTCMTNLCSSCFTTMHSTPGMSTHTSVPYKAVDSLVTRTCKEHSRPLEFVSVEEGKLGCSHCAVFGELRDKKLVDLPRVEREIGESGILKKSVDKVNAALGKLQSLTKNLYCHSSEYQYSKERLESHLARCHRLLEVVGGKLMSQLKQREVENNLSVEQTRTRIGEKIAKLELLVEAAEWQSENEHGERLNLVMLLKEMKKIDEEEDLSFKRDQKPVVTIDQSIFSNISSHISFSMEDSHSSPTIKTVTVSRGQLPQELFLLLDRISETKSVVENKPVRDHFSGMEEVLLLHVESPESLYVMRNMDKRLAESLKNLIRKEWTMGVKGKVKEGDIAVVHTETDEYSRVAVTKVMPDSASVTFLDHGNTSHVPLSRLVCLSDHLSLHSWPPLAHHCTLASVGNTQQWDWQAARDVQRFGGDSVCRATVVGRNASISQSTMLVNITKEDDDENQISLLDYLVYHDLSTRQGGGTCNKIRTVRTFLSGPAVKIGTEHSVVVVQVNSPVEMFVILEDNGHPEKLSSMLKDMCAEYDGEVVDEQMILLPLVGMVCVAKFSEDGKFYRAEVTNLIDERMVRVVFVDFGNSRVVQVGDLRRIQDKFLVLPVMAAKVGLAEVKPLGVEWSEQAAEWVRERMRNKVLTMVVKRGEKKGTTCMVMMYEWNSQEDNCYNTWLVHEGYASATKKLRNHHDLNIFQISRPDIVPSMRTACRVVSASSPARICLRRICQEESFYKLCRELSHHYSHDFAPSVQRHWYEGAACVVRLQGEGWIRAKVVREELEGMVEVMMVDYGTIETVAVDSMRTLHDIFTMAPYSWTVHLTKLIPAGGGKTWTVVACEKVKEVLVRTNMEVDIQVVGEIVVDTWPVDMFVKEKDENAGPLDPEGFIYKSVGGILREEGLAIQPRVGVKSKIDMVVDCIGGGDIDHEEALENGKDVECIGKVLVLAIIDEVLEANFGETKQPDEEESTTSFQWLKADHLNGSDFDCVVSHVDWDCNLYISSIPDNQDSLKLIGSVLESKYSGSSPSQEDLQWSPGEACIVQFCLDRKWYRGEVLRVSDTGKCLVKFVDYGSEELCNPHNLRKNLYLTDVPIQCFTVQMDNVRPITDKWEESVLNLLHETVVDQVLHISITQAKDTFPPLVTLITKSGLDIGNMLVKNGYAREGGKAIIDV